MHSLYERIHGLNMALEAGNLQPGTLVNDLPPEYECLKTTLPPHFFASIGQVKGISERTAQFYAPVYTIKESLDLARALRNDIEIRKAQLPSPVHPLFRLSVPEEDLITLAKKRFKRK